MANRARKQQLSGFHDAHWNLSQTVAWILLREPDMVDRAAGGNVDALALIGRYVTRELANGKEGATTESVTLSTGTVVNQVVSSDIDAGNALREALKVLHRKLAEGKLVAMGVRRRVEGNDPPDKIPAFQWAYLDFEIESSRARPARSVLGENRREHYHVPRWDELRFTSRDVRKIWREGARDQEPPSSVQAQKGGNTAKFDKFLQAVIDHIVRELHSQGTRATLGEIRQFFMKKGAHSFKQTPSPWESPVPACDGLYIDGRPEKWDLCWIDKHARPRSVSHRTVERYLTRANDKLLSAASA